MSGEGLRSIVVEILYKDDDTFAQNFTKEANMNTDAATMLFRAIGIDGMYAVRFAVRDARL